MIASLLLCWVLFAALALTGRHVFNLRGSIWLATLAGMSFWGILAWLATLFGPFAWISTLVVGVFAGISGVDILRKRDFPDFKSRSVLIGFGTWILASVLCVVYAADLPLVFDTGAYHFQMVQWLSRFGAVPGIAHLDVHFGSVSMWFSAAASLEWGALSGKTYHFLNAVPWLAALAGILSALQRSLKSLPELSDLLLLLALPVALFFGRGNIASLSPDLPALVFSFAALYSGFVFLEKLEVKFWILSAVFSFTAISCKLAMAPLFLLPFALAFSHGNLVFTLVKKQFLPAFLAGSLILILFLAHNHVNSGWPLFPSVFWSGFQPDWQLAPERLEQFTRHVKLWGITPEYQKLTSLHPVDWVPAWWLKNVSIHLFMPEMIGLLLFIPLSVLAAWKLNSVQRKPGFSVLPVIWTGMLFWFLSSPNPRFSTFWILSAVSIPAAMLIKFAMGENGLKRAVFVSLGISVLFLTLFLPESGVRARLFGPQQYLISLMRPAPEGPVVPFETADGTVILVPELGNRVFNAPVPAARRGEFCIMRRGARLQDGFKAAPEPCKKP